MPIRSLRLLKSGLAMVVAARCVEAADNGAHNGMEASRHLHHAWTVNARAHALHIAGLEVRSAVVPRVLYIWGRKGSATGMSKSHQKRIWRRVPNGKV